MPSTDSEHASLPEGVVAVIRQGQQVLVIQRGADMPGAGVWRHSVERSSQAKAKR